MSNPTDTNQASEERIRGKLLSAYLDGRFSIEEIGKLTDKQAESVDRVIDRAIKLIRTEKLKLLAELDQLLHIVENAATPYDAKSFITAYTNKQIEAVLDRLEDQLQDPNNVYFYDRTTDDEMGFAYWISAERNKLKESSYE